MKTRFYKILYKNKDVVYVGVTLRPITERFKEHLTSKNLNENYSVIEFDCIEHPEFTTLEVFYEEHRKVAELERKYIREELDKGSKLLNISKGGEWGCAVLEKLKKEEFRKKFGSYDNYEEYSKKAMAVKKWLSDWIRHRSESKVKAWLSDWIKCRSENQVKAWLCHWISDRSKNQVKAWLCHWISDRS